MEEHKASPRRNATIAIGIVCLVLITAVLTFLTTVNVFPKSKCGNVEVAKLSFPKENPEWTDVNRLEIREKNLVISRPTGGNRCYLLPLRHVLEDPVQPRPLVILNQPLSAGVLEHLAGENGAAFCNGANTYLARELKTDETIRRKRDDQQAGSPPAPAAPPAAGGAGSLQGSTWQGTGIFGSSQNQNKQAADVTIDQRGPRCSEVLLDCVDHVGQVQSCYTWVNGIMWMDRKCTDSKQFALHMTKPPGRILKTVQQQWIICLQRRSQGLSC